MSRDLIEQNRQLLQQASVLLDELDDDQFRGPAGRGGESAGVGPHLSHCIDFYRCFLRDVDGGRVDYDRRQRDPRLETERTVAAAALEEINRGLDRVPESQRRLEVRVDVSPTEPEGGAWSPSSVSRELRFLVSHTVHHYALIAQVLRASGREPAAGFGVAPSTLAFWAEVEATEG